MAVGVFAGLLLVTSTPSAPFAMAAKAQSGLALWKPGGVECNGTAIEAAGLRRPLNSLYRAAAGRERHLTLMFDIDADGRPVSISNDDNRLGPSSDVAPALAASRFEAHARRGCKVTYAMSVEPLDSVALPELVSYTLNPDAMRLPQAAWQRIAGQGDCAQEPRPRPLLRAYPDFSEVEASPGARDWTLVGYDTDAGGRPRAIHAIMGTGNTQLTKAAQKAVAQSRFTGGARSHCTYPYWRAPAVLPAPAMPDGDAFPTSAGCPAEVEWETPPRPRFPAAYERRRIEGWAIVAYDIAPWGALGNLKVLAAQPADDFGQQALTMMRHAKAKAGGEGASGCIQRLRFAMAKDADEDGGSAADGRTGG